MKRHWVQYNSGGKDDIPNPLNLTDMVEVEYSGGDIKTMIAMDIDWSDVRAIGVTTQR